MSAIEELVGWRLAASGPESRFARFHAAGTVGDRWTTTRRLPPLAYRYFVLTALESPDSFIRVRPWSQRPAPTPGATSTIAPAGLRDASGEV